MANNDDVRRVLAACTACGSVYAARRWPDGELRVIGQEGCSCGAAKFEVVDESDTDRGQGEGADADPAFEADSRADDGFGRGGDRAGGVEPGSDEEPDSDPSAG